MVHVDVFLDTALPFSNPNLVFLLHQVQDGHPGIWEYLSASGVLASTGTWEYTYPELNQSTWTNGPQNKSRYCLHVYVLRFSYRRRGLLSPEITLRNFELYGT